jgi:hypothetical protein
LYVFFLLLREKHANYRKHICKEKFWNN